MSCIKQLSAQEAQKIAAGEVVERPANVVKELLENALDAGATQITVHLEDAGKELIRVIDNGTGMSPEDAHMSIKQHATSKITCVDDLKTLQTFGFRGEALSSICAVSHLTLTTKRDDAQQGICLLVQDGQVIEESLVPSNTGTDIAVRSLFYNVPARKKFLKKRETELNQIQQLFQAFCLLHTTIHFKLFHDGRMLLNCPPVENIASRFAQLWEHTSNQQILPIHAESGRDNLLVQGAISDHHHHRYDRGHVFIFVNKRWVKNFALAKALLKGYSNVLPQGRFPSACLDIALDSEQVDINIHPRKEEVQFLHPRTVEAFIHSTIKKRLDENMATLIKKTIDTSVPTYHQSAPPTFHPYPSMPEPMRYKVANHDHMPLNFLNPPPPVFAQPFEQEQQIAVDFTRTDGVQESAEANTTEQQNYRLIGQYNKTYLLLEQEEGLFLIDQHAAHERILYELFSKRFTQVATIRLLFPEFITLTKAEMAEIAPYLELFTKNGIEVEPFNDTQLIVQATPVHCKDQSMTELARYFLSILHEQNIPDQKQLFKTLNEKLQAQMACKAAVKAGDQLTTEQMQQLLDDLTKTENRLTCPHGRPTGWLLSLHEIEKKFKRKL